MKRLVLQLILCMAPVLICAQQIVQVTPNTGTKGSDILMTVSVSGVNLQQGQVTASLGTDILITNVQVLNAQVLNLSLTVETTAIDGPRTLDLNVNGTLLTLPDAFSVIPSGIFSVTLEVIPVQSLKVSDFDPSYLDKAPLLFNIRINNDQVSRNLLIKMHISGGTAGHLVTAEKPVNAPPGAFFLFTNRDFEKFNPNRDKNELFRLALETGSLPADLYTYRLEVWDGSNMLAWDEGLNVVNNLVNRPELISPGNPLNSIPQLNEVGLPVFQWFSQASQNEFVLYPVYPGQATKEEICLNRPVYKVSDYAGNVLPYSAAAEALQPGQTYAWQVIGLNRTSRGEERLPSELYWFTFKEDPTQIELAAEIRLSPEDAVITAGGKQMLSLNVVDLKGNLLIPEKGVRWKVIPSEFGTVSPEGVFVSSGKTGICAVLVLYGGKQTFSMIEVTPVTK